MRLDEERPRLRPLKVLPDDLAVRVPIFVGPTAEVIHDTHPYSMPPDAIRPGRRAGDRSVIWCVLLEAEVRAIAGAFQRRELLPQCQVLQEPIPDGRGAPTPVRGRSG